MENRIAELFDIPSEVMGKIVEVVEARRAVEKQQKQWLDEVSRQMDYSKEVAKLEEIIERYRIQFHKGNISASVEMLLEWRQATYTALERAYNKGYNMGDFGEEI